MNNLTTQATDTKRVSNNYVDWKGQLQAILNEHLGKRSNGEIASAATQSDRASFLFGFFKKLRGMGMKVEPRNLKERHVKAVMLEWEKEGLSAATMQKYISHLRQFADWLGKRGMIREAENYVLNPLSVQRSYIASEDKSWDRSELDKYKILQDIFNKDPYVGIQVLSQDVFGLRCKEAICLRPYLAEKNNVLYVTDGTKNGKFRTIDIDSDIKRAVLKKAQHFVNYTEASLGDPRRNLKQNIYRYSNVLRRIGVSKSVLGITGHGLRAGFAMRELEARGLLPILRGGEIGVLPKEKEKSIRRSVAELLGHHRTGITTAYSGPETRYGLLKINKYEASKLEYAISNLEIGKEYRFQTFEYKTAEGELITSAKIDRIFLGTLQVEEKYFFEVRRAVPLMDHAIALEHIRSISEL